MTDYDYDLFVIGAGSGGVRAARMAASFGAKVAVAEVGRLGGTCVNIGCVPKKLFVYASHVAPLLNDAEGFGWRIEAPQFDWPTLIANKNREILRLNGAYENLLRQAGVTILLGRAQLTDAHTVKINDQHLTARHILIAVGGRPFVPEFPGREHAIVSDHAFELPQLPRRILIVGGGYIAVEFACIFHHLGVHVTQLYRGDLFLRGFDDDCRTALAQQMRLDGVDLRFQLNVARIDKQDGIHTAQLTDGSRLEADLVMFATGRTPYTANLGLEQVGVELTQNGAVQVNTYSQSSMDCVYAVGDCTDRVMLTPVAIAEGAAVAQTLFNGNPTTITYDNIASAVFSQPPIGSVGLTEAQAREKFGAVDVYISRFRPMQYALSQRQEQAMMKLIVHRTTDRVLGAHMVGPGAGEIIQGLAIALKGGTTKAQFDATLGVHPTLAEEFVTMRQKRE